MIRGFSRSVATAAAASGSQASLRLQLTGSSTGSSLAERTPGVRLREQPGTPVSRHPAVLPQGRAVFIAGYPATQNPHVFGPPGSVSQRYGSGSESFPFLIKVLSGL
jgi:hypothetical protein